MTVADLALLDAAEELICMEAVAVEALQEASSYRAVCLVAMADAQEQFQRAEKLERRLRQVMGTEAWHPEMES